MLVDRDNKATEVHCDSNQNAITFQKHPKIMKALAFNHENFRPEQKLKVDAHAQMYVNIHWLAQLFVSLGSMRKHASSTPCHRFLHAPCTPLHRSFCTLDGVEAGAVGEPTGELCLLTDQPQRLKNNKLNVHVSLPLRYTEPRQHVKVDCKSSPANSPRIATSLLLQSEELFIDVPRTNSHFAPVQFS